MEVLLILGALINTALAAGGAYLFAMIQINRAGMMKTSRDLQDERRLLAEEMKKLSTLSHEIGSNWKVLNDKVITVENKLVAIQANLNTGTITGFRSPGR